MRARGFLALLLAALWLASAAARAEPREYPLPTTASAATIAAGAIRDYPQAAEAIVTVLVRDLQLPIAPYRLMVYPDVAGFEQALRRHLGMTADTARRTATFAKAAVGDGRVLVNETQMATIGWPERLLTLAHELAHASQGTLAGGRSLVRQQWLVEGFAEWVAFRVVGRLGTHDVAKERARMLQRVRALHASGGLAPLASLDTMDQWVRSRQQRGFDAAYPFSYVAVDLLVQRHGFPALVEYFRQAGTGKDPAALFASVFGESVAAFQQALDASLASAR